MEKENVIESEGKTIEDAIKKGLEALGLTRDEAEIKILSEGTTGLFGLRGVKPAKVMVQKKQNAKPAEPSVSLPSLPVEKKEQFEAFLKSEATEILSLMGFKNSMPEVTVQPKTEVYSIEINFSDNQSSSLLIGKNGKTMKSLEVVMQSMVNRKFKNELASVPRVSIDINKYKIKQEEKLVEVVNDAKKQIKQTGTPHKLEPMPAYMRKIVHTILQDSEFETVSEGEGEDRRVVIKLKK